MAKFPPEKMAEIREKADIERIVGQYVHLKRQGRRLVGLCPFHSEKTPSFGVSTEKNLYHCFGCGTGGDVIDFLMRIEGLEFPEAVRRLAADVGVTLPERDESPEERQRRSERARLCGVNAWAADFYRRCLKKADQARAYLTEERGLTEASLARFAVGWAPADWHTLTHLFEKKSVDVELGVTLGLLGRSARTGRLYDRLRGRVVFPIALPDGHVAGFGARRADWVDPEGPKYLNSPESPVYDKSSILYGLAEGRAEIRKSRRALLVEGYLDVIALFQAGFPQAVAGCGTALTEKHARTLAKMADEVVILYDGDEAGREATEKASLLLLAAGLRARVGALPEGEDPDTLVRREGPDSLQKLIDEAPSAVDFFVARARSAYAGGGIAGTTRALDVVKPMILAIKDPLERDVTLQATARTLGVDPSVLERHLGGKVSGRGEAPAPSRPRAPEKRPSNGGVALPVVETALLKALLEDPRSTLRALESRGALHAFSNAGARAAVHAAKAALEDGGALGGPELLEVMREHGADREALDQLRSRMMATLPNEDPLDTLVSRLLKADKDRRLRAMRERIEQANDPKEAEELMVQYQQLLTLDDRTKRDIDGEQGQENR